MKQLIVLVIFVIFIDFPLFSQNERKYNRQGVRNYEENSFEEAELKFRKANEIKPSSFEASYNTGNALYKQGKTEDAAHEYAKLLENEKSVNKKADLYYNLGNTFLKSGEYQKSIEAFKNTLRLRPEDEDARYNLAWALSKLQEQQNQDQNQNQNQDQEQNQDKEQDQDQNDQDNQDNQDNQQEKEDQTPEIKELSKERRWKEF